MHNLLSDILDDRQGWIFLARTQKDTFKKGAHPGRYLGFNNVFYT